VALEPSGYSDVQDNPTPKEASMGLILLILLLVLLFGGLGFAIHWLWFLAVVFAIAWLAGFAFRSGEGRWYRW
jgi:hypothetical protein